MAKVKSRMERNANFLADIINTNIDNAKPHINIIVNITITINVTSIIIEKADIMDEVRFVQGKAALKRDDHGMPILP